MLPLEFEIKMTNSLKNIDIKENKKIQRGWVFYDWANSVYQLTIASAIFPVYYNQITNNNGGVVDFFGFSMINTVLYSWAIAFAYLVIAVLSPIFSSVADFTGRRKLFMQIFTYIGAISCGALFFFNESNVEFGIIFFALGTFGYGGSIVFYNSFLPVIAKPENQDKISASGYSLGYLGGVVLLILNLVMILKPQWFGMEQGYLAIKFSFLTVFLWWAGFSQITFSRLPKYTFGNPDVKSNVFSNGYKELRSVFMQVRKLPSLTIYLFAYFFMITGLLTVMFMAAIYGEKEIKLSGDVLIGIILGIQLVGMVGAHLFSYLSKIFGNLKALTFSVIIWIIICIGAFFISNAIQFMIVGVLVGLVMGGTQALSRSTYSKMLPDTKDHTSFFSFFDVMEKLATVLGTFSFGLMESLTGSMRYSILTIIIFFLLSLVFLFLLFFIELKNKQLSHIMKGKFGN